MPVPYWRCALPARRRTLAGETFPYRVDQEAIMGGTAFGQRLAELRAERGLSLRELGTLAHYSRGFLWDLEAGNKMPSPTSAARLDEALSAGGQLAARPGCV
jgi:Helix-turn-helix domain